jgi:hypothetical protein
MSELTCKVVVIALCIASAVAFIISGKEATGCMMLLPALGTAMLR